MPIVRLPKTGSYTQIDNSLIGSTSLSALAKLVLIFAMSRPDTWVFSVDGIAYYCKEGADAIGRALRELEGAKLLTREPVRVNGRYSGYIYTFYESATLNPAFSDSSEVATEEKSELDMKERVEPDVDNPGSENHAISMNNRINIIDDLYLNPSINQDNVSIAAQIRSRIDADMLEKEFDRRLIDDIVDVMVGVYRHTNANFRVTRDIVLPTSYVQGLFDRIGPLHIEQILRSLERSNPRVRNMHGYLLVSLVNVAKTMDIAYEYGDF